MKIIGKILMWLVMLSVLGCNAPVDSVEERRLLLASNERQKEAHFEGSPRLLLAEMADTVYTVQRGVISVATKPEMLQRWEAYFKSVKYSRWDDLREPLIHISADATQASVSVNKITVSTLIDDPAAGVDTTYFAWTSEYQKVNGAWKIYKITSTRVAK
ncbi:MAG: hypothetical protein Roseis2KO_19310 [Roseivirga sp.]